MVGDKLLFCYLWFKYSLITLDLLTVEKFGFHFSRALGRVVDYVNIKLSTRVAVNHALCGAQNVCALKK